MEFLNSQKVLLVLSGMAIIVAGIFFAVRDNIGFLNQIIPKPYENLSAVSKTQEETKIIPSIPKLENQPEIIKAVYLTGYSAGSKKYSNYLKNLLENTEINAVVIDIKDYSGFVSYASEVPNVLKYNLYNRAISDIDSLVNFLHSRNIYVIGRITVFEDPAFAKARPDLAVYDKEKTIDSFQPVLWQDNNALSWLDPSSKEVWDYNLSLAKNAFFHGFDEINFDYVRFPTDGETKKAGFPFWDGKKSKAEVIDEFFSYARESLAGEKTSVDLFGLTTIDKNDLGIGQLIESAFKNFDYVSPMLYPSHYADGFLGFENPAEHPYQVVKYSLDSALNKVKSLAANNKEPENLIDSAQPSQNIVPLAKIRPWLQDFNMGADYTPEMVKEEIKATKDSLGDNFKGFMLWNPHNIYSKEALTKEIQ